jgi:hypothetical protein
MKRKSPGNRKSERTADILPTTIEVKGHRFRVNDIGSEGIGIIVEEGGPRLVVGERIDAIVIRLTSGPMTIGGVVTHLSRTTTRLICGIRFLFVDDAFDRIRQFKKERCRSP